MAKKPIIISRCELPPIKVGTPVVILRPHLWSGGSGVVESYNPATTMHYIAVAAKNGAVFHTECRADVLKVDYGRMLEV